MNFSVVNNLTNAFQRANIARKSEIRDKVYKNFSMNATPTTSKSATPILHLGPKRNVFWPKMEITLAQNGKRFGPKRITTTPFTSVKGTENAP